MNDIEKLAREITFALIRAGLLSDAEFTAASRLIKSTLDERQAPANPSGKGVRVATGRCDLRGGIG